VHLGHADAGRTQTIYAHSTLVLQAQTARAKDEMVNAIPVSMTGADSAVTG
jgi:hypothetical protein